MLGKPSAAYFEAALEALDADAELTWMVGDDIEADVAGAQAHGMKHGPRPHGQVPARRGRGARASAGRRSSPRSRSCPTGSRSTVLTRRRRPDRDRARPARARRATRASASGASPRPSVRTATRGRIRRRATPAGSPARRRSARRSASASRARSPGATSRSPGGRSRRVRLSGRVAAWAGARGRGRDRPVDDALARARAAPSRWSTRTLMFEPLYTADEMRAAEAGPRRRRHDGAGGASAVADAVLRRYPGRAPRSPQSAAEAQTAATAGSRSRVLAESGREDERRADARTPTWSSTRCSARASAASRARMRRR